MNDQTAITLNDLPTSATGHAGLISSTTYDTLHRVKTREDSRRLVTTLNYHYGTGLLSSVEDSTKTATQAGNTTSYTYDASGRVKTTTDAAGKVTRSSYTLRGQPWRVWGDAAYPIEYGYDAETGERTTLGTYQAGANWNSETWPGGTPTSVTTWVYDTPSGLVERKKDAANVATIYSYNVRGQVYQRTSAMHTTRELMRAIHDSAGESARFKLMKEEGGCVSSGDAAPFYLFDPTKAASENRLIGIRNSRGDILFPVWQFAESGGALPGLDRVLAELSKRVGYSEISPFAFFLQHHPRTSGRPLDASGRVALTMRLRPQFRSSTDQLPLAARSYIVCVEGKAPGSLRTPVDLVGVFALVAPCYEDR